MDQSKKIQRIEIPSLDSAKKDQPFHLWRFLTTRPVETESSGCPIRGSLSIAREKPIVFSLIVEGLLLITFIYHPVRIF